MGVEQLVEHIATFAYTKKDPPFKLSSGGSSDVYIDMKKVLLNSWTLRVCIGWCDDWMERLNIHNIGGSGVGGAIIVGAVTGMRSIEHRPCYGFVVRDSKKEHGTEQVIEGIVPTPDTLWTNVILVEDVITTGRAIHKVIKLVENAGMYIRMVLALVDREEGGSKMLEEAGYPLHAITTLSEIKEIRNRLVLDTLPEGLKQGILDTWEGRTLTHKEMWEGAD